MSYRWAMLVVLGCASLVRGQVTIHVPAEYVTIQAAIGAAADGDTVLVAPGTYFENINFSGKNIELRSSAGPSLTTIDGAATGSVVTFISGEGRAAILDGFTIQNGRAIFGAGIFVDSSSPTIINNRIVGNTTIPGQSGFGGGMLLQTSNAYIGFNEIAYNTVFIGDAGGVGTTAFTNTITVERNLIHHNTALGNGGGLYLRNVDAQLINNTIAFNTSQAWHGGGIDCYVEGVGPKVVQLTNCIVWGNSSGMAGPQIYNEKDTVDLLVAYSDVEGGWTGTGNIALAPLFGDGAAGDLTLSAGSPCINAGNPSSPTDPDGSVADMGALPFTQPFLSLGSGLAGTNGIPGLVATGTLVAGTPIALILSGAKPFAPSWLVVGVAQLNAPFKGGVMVPTPDLLFAQTTDFFGASSFGGLWPAGVPSGFTTYFQWWISDPAGPKGFAASNALAGTTP